VDVNETIEIKSLVSRAPKPILNEQWDPVGRPSVAMRRQLPHFLVNLLINKLWHCTWKLRRHLPCFHRY